MTGKTGNKCSKCWTAQMHFHCIPGFSMPWFATCHNTKGDGPASSHLHKCLTMRNGSSAILHTLGRSKKSLCLPGCELLSMLSIQQTNRQHIWIKHTSQNHSKYLLGDKKQQRKFRSRSSQSSPHKSVRVPVMGSEKENIRWFLMVHSCWFFESCVSKPFSWTWTLNGFNAVSLPKVVRFLGIFPSWPLCNLQTTQAAHISRVRIHALQSP